MEGENIMIKRCLSILTVCMMLTSLIPTDILFADELIQEMSEKTVVAEDEATALTDEEAFEETGQEEPELYEEREGTISADEKFSEETGQEEPELYEERAGTASAVEKSSEETGQEELELYEEDAAAISAEEETSGETGPEETELCAEDDGLTEEGTENPQEFSLIDDVQIMEGTPGIAPISGDEQEITLGQTVSIELEGGGDISQDQEFSFTPKKDGYYRLVISGFEADSGLRGSVRAYDENHYEKFSGSFDSNQKYRIWIPAKTRYLFHLSAEVPEGQTEGTVKFQIKIKKAPDVQSISVKNVPEGPWDITEVSEKLKQADFEVLYSDDTSLLIENWEAGGWYHNDFSGVYLTGSTSVGDTFLLQLVGDYIPQSVEENPVPLTGITPAGTYQIVLYETSRGNRKIELTGASEISVEAKSISAEKLELDGTYKLQFEKDDIPVYYKYTPLATGTYSLDMTGSEMKVTLYDENFHQLARQYGRMLPRMVYELEAEKAYYYQLTGPAEPEEELSIHFYKVNDVTETKLISLPDKRDYIIGTDKDLVTTGARLKLTYADGSEQVLSEDNGYEDGKGNSVTTALYKSDAGGNPDYENGGIGLKDVKEAGIYWLSLDVYTVYGDFNYSSMKFLTHNPIQITFARAEGDFELKLTADSLKLRVKQSTKKLKVSEMAEGDSLVSVKSSNTKILKVSKVKADGTFKLTAKKTTGTVNLTITLASGAERTIKIKVQKDKVTTTKIKGVKKKLTLKAGEKKALEPKIKPITTQDELKFTSSDKEIASVSKKGVITAKKAGKAEITVQSGSKEAVCVVTVEE